MKQGNWSEDPTQLYPSGRRTARLLEEESFEHDEGRTVLEPPRAIEALVYASVVAPETGAKRPHLPLPASLRQVLSGAPGAATPRIPHLATPRPLRIVAPRAERRLTLTPLPGANRASVANQAEVPVEALPPLKPITRPSRQGKVARSSARRLAIARYRFIGLVALAGFGLGAALLTLVRAVM
jgi:hypothetical protein